jgi:glyoxylase-like metal-dependent hydrolase (beta-lactamase superfamily II)
MHLGAWQLDTINGGRFRIDGGVLFGLVPKTLWGSLVQADARNRVDCGNRCVLARDGRHTVLIDTGCGTKYLPLDRKFYAIEDGDPLLEDLATLGVRPEDVDTVLLTHLHFDHVGGATRYDQQGQLVPTFPKARYLVSRIEWEDATIGGPELQTAYSLDNLLPLVERGQLVLLDDDPAIVPGLTAICTGGHTRGHLAVKFSSAGQTAFFIGDLCPTTAHLRRMWCTAYDVYPLETRRRKPVLLDEAAKRRWLVLWNHDPGVAAGFVACDPKREFVVEEPRDRL